VNQQLKPASYTAPPLRLPWRDRILTAASRYNSPVLLALVFCAVAVVAAFVIRDLQAANAEAETMYAGSVHGLQRIGELQYDAQETRRATLYALTTSDSNLQVEYADQSRNADQRVKDAILEYTRQAKRPAEIALASRLSDDWGRYLRLRDEVLASILEGSTKEAVALDLSGGVPSFELVREDLNEVKTLYDQDASQRLANVVATSHRSALRVIGILGFTFLLSSAAVWAIQRSRMLSAIQLAKLQMEFVASVSHELRTPLAVLSSAADNIADGLVDGKAAIQKYGAVLQNQSRRMSGLVDEILLFASTEDGKNRYVLRPLSISQILSSVLASTEALAQGKGFVIAQQIDPDLPAVMGDLTAISQCLQNLIGNAVKYSGDNRWISLRAAVHSSERGGEPEVCISVADRGIGIERSELGRIFDPFYRSPRVNEAQIHGTGLGLSLAKRIAEAMGGRLSVVSELSTGSTFTLHLRIAKGEDPSAAPAASRPASSSPV
jgi:signal transduction histidine kinase